MLLQVALHAVAEAGVDPTDRDQDQAEDDERENARQGIQMAQVLQKELQNTAEQQGEAGEPLHAVAEWEAGGQECDALQAPGDGQQAARNLVEEQAGQKNGGEQRGAAGCWRVRSKAARRTGRR
jgi:hypothetical protein